MKVKLVLKNLGNFLPAIFVNQVEGLLLAIVKSGVKGNEALA
jgi:hypothetical protein